MKTCSRCGKEKKDIEFQKSSNSKDGLQCYCRECSKEYRREWRASGKTARPSEDTWGNPEWVREYHRKRYHLQSEEQRREKERAKKEKALAKLKIENPIAYERRINWGQKKKLHIEKTGRYWARREDRDCVETAKTANRRAKALGVGGKINPVDVYRLVSKQDGLCAICKMDITRSFHLDHIIPLSKSGINHADNLQILCGPCNVRKGNK